MENYKADIIVVGGGPGGMMAAYAASKEGLDTILIEKNGFLGGCGTACMVMPMMSFYAGEKKVVGGYADELIARIKKEGGTIGHVHDPIMGPYTLTPIDLEIYKYVSMEMLLEAGVKLYFHSEVVDANVVNNEIESITVHTVSGNYLFSAKEYIDCTGNASLVSLAGEDYMLGRDEDGKTQPMSLIFTVKGVDRQRILSYIKDNPQEFCMHLSTHSMEDEEIIAISGFFSLVKEAQKNNDFSDYRDRILAFELNEKGEMTINTGRIINHVDVRGFDLSEAEIIGRKQMWEILRLLNKYIPGFENAKIKDSAACVGVRESRRLNGTYVLNERDILNHKQFEDVIALGNWPIDIHSPDGKDVAITEFEEGSYYHIPYRSLVPKKIDNLLVGGRIISTTHEAFASTRVSPTCMAIGQAAGIASALCCLNGCFPRQMDISKLKRKLVESGQLID